MANLRRFEPYGDIARFEPFREMEDLLRDLRMGPGWRGLETEPRMRVDVVETEQAYTIKAEIPGVKKEDIKVSVQGDQVTLSAEIREEKNEQGENMLRSERYYGQQSRSFSLPQEVDDASAQAKYQDGILELTLPKKPGRSMKQLPIQ